MATEDIVGGLFGINPDMYRQQQQQQVFNRAVALQNLDPFQQAAVGYQQAGYNLAGALGGALGGVDPQLQRISALNAISKQIDQTNPESMLQGAKLLADAGFTQEALGLAQYARKANSEIALAQQRQRESPIPSTDVIKNATALADASGFAKGTPEYNNVYKEALTAQTDKSGKADVTTDAIKNAEYAGNLRVLLDELKSKPQNPDTEKQIALLEARLAGLPQPKEATLDTKILQAQRAGQIVNQLAVIKALPKEQQSLEAIRALETELAVLNPVKEQTQTEAMKNAIYFADFSRFAKGTREYNMLVQEKFAEYVAKPLKEKAQSEFEQLLADSGMTEDQKKAARAARVTKESTFAPPVQVSMPVAVEDPNRLGSVIYVDRPDAVGKTPATAIEGLGPKEIQIREAKYPQAITALKGFDAKTAKLTRDIDDLINNKKGLNEITGFFAGRTDLSAMSAAGRRALSVFNTITAKGGFSELQDMRNASPTGGALGNVSNTEGKQLIDSFGALSRTQNADDLRSSLTTIKTDLQGSKQRVKEAFDETYSYRANRGSATAPAAPVSRGVDINNPLLKN